jgi:hypothetical protein
MHVTSYSRLGPLGAPKARSSSTAACVTSCCSWWTTTRSVSVTATTGQLLHQCVGLLPSTCLLCVVAGRWLCCWNLAAQQPFALLMLRNQPYVAMCPCPPLAGPDDVVLLTNTICFDAHVTQVPFCLRTGWRHALCYCVSSRFLLQLAVLASDTCSAACGCNVAAC